MRFARTRFWLTILLCAGIWLLALLWGGAGSEHDEPLRRILYAGQEPALARNAALLTWLGDSTLLIPLGIVAALFLFVHRKIRAALLLIILFGGRLLIELQKVIFNRDRPGVDEHLEAVYSMSFPSGHAGNAMITYLAIALLLPVGQRNRAIAVVIGLAMALASGWSRVALGVHWPSDVVGGWAFGMLWVVICMRLASARPEPDAS